MATKVAETPKYIDPERFGILQDIRPEAWVDIAEALNLALATVGMGQLIGQGWADGEFLLEGDDNAGTYTVFNQNLPKVVYNPQKLSIWVKCCYDYNHGGAAPANPSIIRFRSRRVGAGVHDTIEANVPAAPIWGVTPGNRGAQRVWVNVGVLDIPFGDRFELEFIVVNRDTTYTYIEQISASYEPLWEDDGAGGYNFVYEPLEENLFALWNAESINAQPFTNRLNAYPIDTSRLEADAPLSAWLGQAMSASLKHLFRRERIYATWIGVTLTEYDLNDKFAYMPAHYNVSLFMQTGWPRETYTMEEEEIRGNYPFLVISTERLEYEDPLIEEDVIYSLYTPQTREEVEQPLFSVDGTVREHIPLRAGDAEVDAKVVFCNSFQIPYVALPEHQPFTPNTILYTEFEENQHGQPSVLPPVPQTFFSDRDFGFPLVSSYLRVGRGRTIDGVRTLNRGVHLLLPWGLVTYFEQKGI